MIVYNMSREAVELAGKAGATGDNEARVLDTFNIITDKGEQSVGQWLANDGFWESWITSWMTSNIKPGFTCVDVGANYGYYTRIMEILATNTGKVFAFEANPALAEGITNSVMKYPVQNGAVVNLYPVAVSDTKGIVTLNIPPKYLGGSSIVWGRQDLPSDLPEHLWTESIEVESDTLDSLLKYVKHIDLIKIDIEGAEPLAWAGMQEILERTDTIIMEIGTYLPREFIDELYSRYDIYIVENDGSDRKILRQEFNTLTDLIMGVLRKK